MSSRTADSKNVLLLIKGLGLGGAERLIADAASSWDRDQYHYRVAYYLPWKDQLVGTLEASNVATRCIGTERGMGLRAVSRLNELIDEWQIDLVHAHLPSAGIVARYSKAPAVVYTEHNLADSYRQPTRSVNRWSYRRNDAVIAVSEAVAGSVAHFGGPKPLTIPNGVSTIPPDGVDRIRSDLGLDPSLRMVVHVGNIRPHKGHSNLIAAVAALSKSRRDFLVLSVGTEKHEGDLDRVREEARQAGVEDLIEFTGRRDDARTLIAAADLVVNPSDVEGLPIVLLEALAYARPVVATAVGGVPDLVRDRITGLLVPPMDPEALARAMSESFEEPEAKVWANRGRDVVQAQHGIAGMVAKYEDVYRGLLDG